MKAPSPPPTPDPYKTAAAQQMANVEVALANTFLQNADEDRPDGTVRWVQTGEMLTTYTYDGSGNTTGSRDIPKFKKIVEFTEEGQVQFTQQQQIAIALNTWALAQVGLLAAQQAIPLSLNDLTPRLTPPTAAEIDQAAVTASDMQMSIDVGDLTAHMATTRDAIDARIQYQIEIDRAARIVMLASQGLVPGMTAYDRDLEAFDRQSTDARLQAWLTAQQEQTRIIQLEGAKGAFVNDAARQKLEQDMKVIEFRNARRLQQYQALRDAAEFVALVRQQELQERLTIRSQNINEIASLMHGGQVAVPQFQGFNPGKIDRTPVADSVYQSAAMDMQKWQVKVQQQQSMMGGLLGFGGQMMGGLLALSDRRLKTDIALVGTDARGIRWYLWRYLWDKPGTHRFGVMAQEVQSIVPRAVHHIGGGYLAVDYGALHG